MAERDSVRWGIRQRFELIEWRVFWHGRVNRSDLEEFFGVSTPQASLDLRAYDEAAPNNIVYSVPEKAYVPTAEFKPKFYEVSADRYLRQLDAILNGALSPADTWFKSLPPAAVMQTIARRIQPSTLQAVLAAIPARKQLKIQYQSLTNTRWRMIAPHALGFDGNRWHARAWCVEHREFRDFVLSRIRQIGEMGASDANPSYDLEWHTFVDFKIKAHPGLNETQRRTIELDFGMEDGLLVVPSRIALAFYLERRLNLDLSDEEISPERKQIILINRAEIHEARVAAKSAAQAQIATLPSAG